MNKNIKSMISAAVISTTASLLPAQTSVATATSPEEIGRGAREFTISGGGNANKQLNESIGGLNFSLGKYYTETLEGLLRQSVNYANPSTPGSSSVWSASTKLAIDQHLGTGKTRPFLGANLGYVYGGAVSDTWVGGLEGGVKYYLQPRTFLVATVEYGWFFRSTNSIDDRFDTGQFNWSLGVGFNY